MPSSRLYQSDEVLTADEKALAYKLANVWQEPVFIYITGNRTVEFTTEKLGRREPQEAVFPSEKGKPRKLEDEPVLSRALAGKTVTATGDIYIEEGKIKAGPPTVVVDDGSDLV